MLLYGESKAKSRGRNESRVSYTNTMSVIVIMIEGQEHVLEVIIMMILF